MHVFRRVLHLGPPLVSSLFPRTSSLKSSINIIGAADLVSQAVGEVPEDVRSLYDESNRWRDVEAELRTMLNGVAGAIIIRRQRLALIMKRICGIGSQLATDPSHAVLVPQIEEIKRLKRIARRKKPAPPETPSPAGASSETKT